MRIRHKTPTLVSMWMLDVFCCALGCVTLLWLLNTRQAGDETEKAKTAPVVATSFMSGYDLPWGQIMATGTMIALPVIIFSIIVSRQFVRGLTMGAIK